MALLMLNTCETHETRATYISEGLAGVLDSTE